jgi:hypothetical protein
MIPEIGSVWIAGDGRILRVTDVLVPADPSMCARVKMTVVNWSGGRRQTTMSTRYFGTSLSPGFLRPHNDNQ